LQLDLYGLIDFRHLLTMDGGETLRLFSAHSIEKDWQKPFGLLYLQSLQINGLSFAYLTIVLCPSE
jgi:hypothetical protein